MIDKSTDEPLHVFGDRESPGLIMAPVSQLEVVRRALDEHRIPYWIDEEYISIDDGPYVAFINFSRDIDPERIQKILDAEA